MRACSFVNLPPADEGKQYDSPDHWELFTVLLANPLETILLRLKRVNVRRMTSTIINEIFEDKQRNPIIAL